MSDEVANLTLTLLRRVEAKIDGIGERVDAVERRLAPLEQAMAGVRRDLGTFAEVDAHLQVGLDRIARRQARIERRPDLVDID